MSFFLSKKKEEKEAIDILTTTLTCLSIEELTGSAPSILGESPHYCNITNQIIYVDINGKRIIVYDPKTNSSSSMQMSQMVAFAIPTNETRKRKDGTMLYLVVGLEDRIVEVNFTDKIIMRTISEIPSTILNQKDSDSIFLRFNDGKASPDGELYAGYMHIKWREGNGGYLFRLDNQNGHLKTLISPTDLGLPNGLAFTTINDKSCVYFIDSQRNTINLYEVFHDHKTNEPDLFGVNTAEICCNDGSANVHEFKFVSTVYNLEAEYINKNGMLDGMTLDSDGKIWVAVPGCSCILRIDPLTNKVIYKLMLPVIKPTACTFGGSELESLYITTRNPDGSNEPQALLLRCKIDGIKGAHAGHEVKISRENNCCKLPDMLSALSIKF